MSNMLVAVERDVIERMHVQFIGHTRGTFYSIVGALSEDGFNAMQEWLLSLAEPGFEGTVPYELDPNARPDANFMSMMARTQEDGGGMAVQRVKAGQELPPQFAEMAPMMARLQQLEAAKAN